MRRASMPRGSSFPFHPTTTTLFRYSSTSLVTTPSADSTSCPRSTSRRIGFSRALCLGHRRAPFSSFIFLPFSDRIRCTIRARRYNPRSRHPVLSPYSPNPRSHHASFRASCRPRVFILRLSSYANPFAYFFPLQRYSSQLSTSPFVTRRYKLECI